MQPNALLIRQNFIVVKSGCYRRPPFHCPTCATSMALTPTLPLRWREATDFAPHSTSRLRGCSPPHTLHPAAAEEQPGQASAVVVMFMHLRVAVTSILIFASSQHSTTSTRRRIHLPWAPSLVSAATGYETTRMSPPCAPRQCRVALRPAPQLPRPQAWASSIGSPPTGSRHRGGAISVSSHPPRCLKSCHHRHVLPQPLPPHDPVSGSPKTGWSHHHWAPWGLAHQANWARNPSYAGLRATADSA
jgi:hypothetical protein